MQKSFYGSKSSNTVKTKLKKSVRQQLAPIYIQGLEFLYVY